ncbi:hypothetical protein GCM10023094_04760 [Rhodococcus olei]|uniref:Uncharacterized protein n=1 Tax=Rhodococcus olei TaxID=2161675 RepID=A0ABP8NVQ1_9NOCA
MHGAWPRSSCNPIGPCDVVRVTAALPEVDTSVVVGAFTGLGGCCGVDGYSHDTVAADGAGAAGSAGYAERSGACCVVRVAEGVADAVPPLSLSDEEQAVATSASPTPVAARSVRIVEVRIMPPR